MQALDDRTVFSEKEAGINIWYAYMLIEPFWSNICSLISLVDVWNVMQHMNSYQKQWMINSKL
jgi:hypothetical protein